MLTSKDLQRYLNQHHIDATILHLKEATPTVPEAARVLNVTPEEIIKSLIFLVQDIPILVIANGTRKVDRRKLAQRFDVGQKRIKFASPAQALEITGFVVGSMPPFGHKIQLPTVVDKAVMKQSTIYGGGGDVHTMLKLSVSMLLELTAAEVRSIVEED